MVGLLVGTNNQNQEKSEGKDNSRDAQTVKYTKKNKMSNYTQTLHAIEIDSVIQYQ